MKIITEANKAVLKCLSNFYKDDKNVRMIHYVVETPAEDGVLLYNLLTFEMIFLTKVEYDNRTESEYLKTHWFLIPENLKEKELVNLIKVVLKPKQEKFKNITGYTIFPTTDCNARCFYCFELGRSRIPMTDETAHKVAQYICSHCGEKEVRISWFGGEPLINQSAIDIICTDLINAGIKFKSHMISNGYLFDEETVKKAVSLWNLKRVQITLDGREAVYNKTKAYVYKDTNPYQIVLNNIKLLLDADILVPIRLNMDLYNAEELLSLVDELAERFDNSKKLRIYAHYIFDINAPMAEIHSGDEWQKREDAMCRLEDRIKESGFAVRAGISKQIQWNRCMADNGSCVTILPSGNIGLCEHYSEDEYIGHINSDSFDDAVIKRWCETCEEIPECDDCFYYPQCIRLKKCSNSKICFSQLQNSNLRKVKQQMQNEYQSWLKKTESDESDDTTLPLG